MPHDHVVLQAEGEACRVRVREPAKSGARAARRAPLSTTHSALAKQWHPVRNGELAPWQVTYGSALKVWWVCSRDPTHEWEASISNRARLGRGCPFCARGSVRRTQRLDLRFPRVAAEWHPTRNGDLRPEDVAGTSGRRLWWICPEGPDHEWESTVANRTVLERGCPFCGRKRVSIVTSLAVEHPDVAAEWSPKNARSSMEVLSGAAFVAWWVCARDQRHEWRATVASRTGAHRSGCPYCARIRIDATNSLAVTMPELAAQWHPTKNGDLRPEDVAHGAKTRVWWRCPEGPDHEWAMTLDVRSRASRCPFCAGRRVSVTNSLKVLFPGIAAEWHPTRNGKLRAGEVVAGAGKKVWWKCRAGPDHEWQATVQQRTTHRSACPFCADRRVSVTNCLATVNPKIAAEWHPTRNGKVGPDGVIATSKDFAWWRCALGHDWRCSVRERVVKARGCPTCVSAVF